MYGAILYVPNARQTTLASGSCITCNLCSLEILMKIMEKVSKKLADH